MAHTMEHCDRPWWKRPPFWFIGIALVLALVIGIAFEESGKRAPMTYGAFLDQLEAGNVASVTFQGTEIDGHFKRPLDNAQSDAFRSRVPDFGDPTLIPELRKQHVVIDVHSPSQWLSLLGRLPWPMVLFIGAVIVIGFARLLRGGKPQSGSAGPMMPMQGMMGLLSGFFAKPPQQEKPPPRDSDGQKSS